MIIAVIRLKVMRYSISTLILMLALVGVACGWIAERRFYDANLEKAGSFGHFAAMATFTNEYFSNHGSLTSAEHERQRRNQLVLNIIYLFQNRPNAITKPYDQMDSFVDGFSPQEFLLAQANQSLDLLRISDAESFVELYLIVESESDWMMRDQYRQQMFDANSDALNDGFAEFLREALDTNGG